MAFVWQGPGQVLFVQLAQPRAAALLPAVLEVPNHSEQARTGTQGTVMAAQKQAAAGFLVSYLPLAHAITPNLGKAKRASLVAHWD